MKLKLVNRYSVGNGTKEEVEKFNEFYDLEEARFNHEDWVQRLDCHNKYDSEFIEIFYPTFQHP